MSAATIDQLQSRLGAVLQLIADLGRSAACLLDASAATFDREPRSR